MSKITRVKVKAYLPLISYEEEVGNYYTGKEDYIVPPSSYGWVDAQISTESIENLIQYDKDTVMITYISFTPPVLVKGTVDSIQEDITNAEYYTHSLFGPLETEETQE